MKLKIAERRLVGYRSQKRGSEFENYFHSTCKRQSIVCVRVPDGCIPSPKGLIRVSSPFDFILAKNKKSAIVDTKTTSHSTMLTWSRFKQKSNINQVQNMSKLEVEGNFTAGFVIYFSDVHKVFFLPNSRVVTALLNGEKGRVKETDMVPLGSIFNFDLAALFL